MRHEGSIFKLFGGNIRRALQIIIVVAVSVSAADARTRSARPEPVPDETAFDGTWSVVIQTETGPCTGSYRYGVSIVDGAVTHEGTPYGRVLPNGRVRVQLSLGDQQAEGVGRLSFASGTGVWRGVGGSGTCTGRWFAERREGTGTYGAGR